MNIKVSLSIVTMLLTSVPIIAHDTEQPDSLTRELQEVIINAKQPSTKLYGSTLVTTITGSNLAELGTALDVLAQLPMIRVENNEISIIGRNSVEIYIDGRLLRDEAELQHIPSTNLNKIELLTAPGAMYESSTAAILRISTKRYFAKGLSITEQLQLQRRRKWSVTDYIGLSYHTNNWEFFLDGSLSHNNILPHGFTTNTLIYEGKETMVGSCQSNSSSALTGVIKGGLNYSKESQSFGAYYRCNPEHGVFLNSGSEWFNSEPVIRREINKGIHADTHLVSLYYENTFANKYLLHFDGDFRKSRTNNAVNTTYPAFEDMNVNSVDHRKSILWAGKLYLNFPVLRGNLTIGTQDSYTRTVLDYRMLNPQISEYIPSSSTDARQLSASLFASWSRSFGKFFISAGTRYEYVDYDFLIDGKHDEDESRRDHQLTPDLSVSYSFNDVSQITCSYKVATVKPPYSQLTGSLNYVGRHEIEGGNPTLRDEKMHDIQFSGMWKELILQADFVRSLDSYGYVKEIYPAKNLQLLMRPVNLNVSFLSLYLIWTKPVGRWTPNITVGMYRQWLLLDNTPHNKPILSYYFDNTLSLPLGWTVTTNISGRTAGDMQTNRFSATLFTMDATISKKFFKKSLTIKLSATDIFNTASHDWSMKTYGILVDKRQSYDQRGIALSVIYNFQPRKSKYKGSTASEAEMNRL